MSGVRVSRGCVSIREGWSRGWGVMEDGVSRGMGCPQGCVSRVCTHPSKPGGRHPRGQTNICENITLPQTSFAGGN